MESINYCILQIYVKYDDDQSLPGDKLDGATVTLRAVVTTVNGQLRTLPDVVIPRKGITN